MDDKFSKIKNVDDADLKNLTAVSVIEKIKSKQISCKDLVKYYLSNIEKHKNKNAILEVFDNAIIQAEKIDDMVASGASLPALAGLPIIIKDNILYKGKTCSCGSKFMQNHKAQYNATVIDRLLDAGVVILGRANMDEFALGASCENSAFGPCLNAFDNERVSGGSSGGSAVAVALDMCTVALGSDTGGSIRQPASFNGLIGSKPTYGRVSRYGLAAYGSSFDQISAITKTVEDNALILKYISGKDINDETSLNNEVPDYFNQIKKDIKGLRIGILKETKQLTNKTEYKEKYEKIAEWFKNQGAEVSEYSVPAYELGLAVYFALSFAELSSNMGRFDGVKFTTRSEDSENIDKLVTNSRTEGLGKEVKCRILLGNFVLSSGNYDDYYLKALKIRKQLQLQYNDIFKKCDILISPTTIGEAFKLNNKIKNPVDMYVEDMFLANANVTGNPAITVPCGTGVDNLPLGLQMIADNLNEDILFSIADYFEKNFKEEK